VLLEEDGKGAGRSQAAGGKGAFHTFPPLESSGHRLEAYPDVWASLVEAYLKGQGLPTGE